MIAEAIIGSATSIILASLWLANSITKRVEDKEEAARKAKEPPPIKPPEKVYPFNKETCHLCGHDKDRYGYAVVTCRSEGELLRRSCTVCKGSYLMELAASDPIVKPKTGRPYKRC